MQNNQDIWEATFGSREWGSYPENSLIRFFARNYYNISDRNGIKVLELGCGTGANLWYLAREGFMVFGIDFSSTACEKLRVKLEKEQLSGQVGQIITGDYLIQIEKFPDNYFDVIFDIESLYCNSFEATKSMIKKCHQKLKQGGRMFSQTFTERSAGFTAVEIEYHRVRALEGPLTNLGLSRFTTKEDILELYEIDGVHIENLEIQELHKNNAEIISEWLISSVKS